MKCYPTQNENDQHTSTKGDFEMTPTNKTSNERHPLKNVRDHLMFSKKNWNLLTLEEKVMSLEYAYISVVNFRMNKIKPRDHFVVSVIKEDSNIENGYKVHFKDYPPLRCYWDRSTKPAQPYYQRRHAVTFNKEEIDQTKLFDILVDEIKFFHEAKYFTPGVMNFKGRVLEKQDRQSSYFITLAFQKGITNIDEFVEYVQKTYPIYSIFLVEKTETAVTFHTRIVRKGIKK